MYEREKDSVYGRRGCPQFVTLVLCRRRGEGGGGAGEKPEPIGLLVDYLTYLPDIDIFYYESTVLLVTAATDR